MRARVICRVEKSFFFYIVNHRIVFVSEAPLQYLRRIGALLCDPSRALLFIIFSFIILLLVCMPYYYYYYYYY